MTKRLVAMSLAALCAFTQPVAADEPSSDKKFVEALCYQMFSRRIRQLNPWIEKSEFDSEATLGKIAADLNTQPISSKARRLYELCVANSADDSNSAIDLCLDLDMQPWTSVVAKLLMDEHSYGGKQENAPELVEKLSKASYPECYLLRGIELSRKPEAALAELNIAQDFDNTRALALYCKGLVYNRAGDSRKSLECLEESRKLSKPSLYQLIFEGWMAKKCGEYAKALQCYEIASTMISPNDGLRKNLVGSEIRACKQRMTLSGTDTGSPIKSH